MRQRLYLAAICRCFPGRKEGGGDCVPNQTEIEACQPWLEAEMAILKLRLVIPVGKLAISRFLTLNRLTEVVGTCHRGITWQRHTFDLIALPHPSGASTWHRQSPGRELTDRALALLSHHPAVREMSASARARPNARDPETSLPSHSP